MVVMQRVGVEVVDEFSRKKIWICVRENAQTTLIFLAQPHYYRHLTSQP